MTIVRAFAYMFNDRHWRGKLTETAVFVLLLPFPGIGLICLCVLLGYLAEIIHNISADHERPLPEWDHIGEDIRKGIPILLAMVVYHLPLLLAAMLFSAARASMSPSLLAGIDSAAPLMVGLYFLVAWSLFSLGLVRYAETWESERLYQIDRELGMLQRDLPLALGWLATVLVANAILLALLPAFLLGAFLFVPVHGYLAGSYARRLRRARQAHWRRSAAGFAASRSAEATV